jgi:hypothetical protein
VLRRLSPILACLLAAAAPASASTPHAVLRKAEAALEGHAGKPGVEPTAALRALATRLPALRGADRVRARRLLMRPVEGRTQDGESAYSVPEHDPPFCSAHFCIHWVGSGVDAPPLHSTLGDGVPDYIRTMDQIFEHAYQVENVQLGWHAPKGDGARGGGVNKVDVYVKDVGGQGIFGYSAPDGGQTGHSQFAYLVMDNDYRHAQFPRYTSYLAPMEVTAAHEYNHVLQFGYDVFQDTWFLEATAVWMEDRVYDGVNDYVSYVRPWTHLTQVPLTHYNELDGADPLNAKAYGDAVWSRWLDVHFGPELIRSAFERSVGTNPVSFAPAAYDAALRARGSSFFDAFTRFAADSAEWRSAAGPFGDRDASMWPDVQRASGRTLAPGRKGISGHLDHTAYALVDVAPTHDARVKLVGSLARGTAGALALVGREGSATAGAVRGVLTRLPHGGPGTVVLSNPSRFTRITAVIVNADASQSGYSHAAAEWTFTRDGRAVEGHISNRFAPLALRGIDPGRGARKVSRRARIVLRFSAAVRRASLPAIHLIGPRGRRVAVRVVRGGGGRRVTLIPRRPLAPGARYSVELGARVVDVDGNALDRRPRGWTFATR